MTIDLLVGERSLVRETFDDAQVAGYWARAATSFADAQVAGLSSAGALHLAYTAALRTTVAVLAIHGLRVTPNGDDHTAFHAAENLGWTMGRHGEGLDAVRRAGDQLIDGPEDDKEEIAKRLRRAIDTLRDVLPDLRAEILSARPALTHSLPLPDS